MDVVLIILLVVVMLALVIVRLRMRTKTDASGPDDGLHERKIGDGLKRLNANKEKYAYLTADMIAKTPDDMLIEAVLSNLWAKMDVDMSDAQGVMATQTIERQYVYAVYAVTGGVSQEGFTKVMRGADAQLIPIAQAALEDMNLPQSAMLLAAAMEAPDADTYDEPYIEAFEGEAGKAHMIDYIRSHASGFTDGV